MIVMTPDVSDATNDYYEALFRIFSQQPDCVLQYDDVFATRDAGHKIDILASILNELRRMNVDFPALPKKLEHFMELSCP